jgi:RNA polymerase sigma-70 factor (ECF subfamily)
VERGEELRLLQRARLGDADAFAELYQDNVQAIYRYIVNRVNDIHLAEDLTGDVFTKALQGLNKYQDQGKPFVAWLYRIAHARVVDYYRKNGRRQPESDIDDENIHVDPEMDEGMDQGQMAQLIQAAIADLTDDQQQVVVLRFMEGYRIEVVAQLMGKQPNAIKALQHRALRTLAKRLEKAGFDLESILAGIS